MSDLELVLKQCPFCGSDAEIQFGGRGSCVSQGLSFVKCRGCGAIGQKFELSRYYASDVKAIEAWNRRVEEPTEHEI